MIPAKDDKPAGDLLCTADAPNRTWVMDVTHVRTWAGSIYTAFILDVVAQKILAWTMAPTKTVELLDMPLRTTPSQRNRKGHPVVRGELTAHPDAGSQYTPITLTDHLTDEGIPPSTGSLADAYDNARTECVTGLCKTDCIGTTVFPAGPLPDHR